MMNNDYLHSKLNTTFIMDFIKLIIVYYILIYVSIYLKICNRSITVQPINIDKSIKEKNNVLG